MCGMPCRVEACPRLPTSLPACCFDKPMRVLPLMQGGGVHGNAVLTKFDVQEVAVVPHRWELASFLPDSPACVAVALLLKLGMHCTLGFRACITPAHIQHPPRAHICGQQQ